MRRSDRRVTDPARLRAWLARENHLHLAMTDGDQPYLVCMNYGCEMTPEGELTLYLHSAGQGRKLDILARNPRVCFEISHLERLLPSDIPCRWTAQYYSIVGSGEAVLLGDRQEKARALSVLLRHLGHTGDVRLEDAALDQIAVLRVDVAQYEGKSNMGAEA